MNSLALALTPVPLSGGMGAGAITGTSTSPGHRNHTLCENTDGNRRAGTRRGSQAPHGPWAPCFPLSFHHPSRLPASGRGLT
jgi:hypothetical protein